MKLKCLLLVLAVLFPMTASAIKIEKDEIDEFTGNRTVITSWEYICGHSVAIRFRQQNGFKMLDLTLYSNSVYVIGKDDHLMFKSTTDNIAKFSSIFISSSTSSINRYGVNTSGISTTYEGDLEYFTNNITRLMRIYTVDSYIDKKVSEGDGRKLCELYGVFASTLGSEVGSAIASYKLTYLKKGVNDKEWFKDYEIVRRHKSREDIQKYKEEWESKSDEKTQYKLIVKRLNTDE